MYATHDRLISIEDVTELAQKVAGAHGMSRHAKTGGIAWDKRLKGENVKREMESLTPLLPEEQVGKRLQG
jgi:hypothetical protein